MCPLEVFNAHNVCVECSSVACIKCSPKELKCAGGKNHSVFKSVVHSDVRKIEATLQELRDVAQDWSLMDVAPIHVTKSTLKSARMVEEDCEGAKIKHSAFDNDLLILDNDEVNEKAFTYLLAAGQPFIVECKDSLNTDFWKPTAIAKEFGHMGGNVKNAETGETYEHSSISTFFRDMSEHQEHPVILKIADFPEGDCKMETAIPNILREVHDSMPFKRHILPTGPMNMVSSIHWKMGMPDVKPKFFAGYGTTKEETATCIHRDLANAANICVHAEECPANRIKELVKFLRTFVPNIDERQVKEQKIAALWYIFLPDQIEAVRDYIQKKNGDRNDPLEMKNRLLKKEDLAELERRHKVKPIFVIQRQGDVAIVPANLPHQVINVNSCIKMAYDFVTASTCGTAIDHLYTNVRPTPQREDYIGIPRCVYHGTSRAAKTLISATGMRREKDKERDAFMQDMTDLRREKDQETNALKKRIADLSSDNDRKRNALEEEIAALKRENARLKESSAKAKKAKEEVAPRPRGRPARKTKIKTSTKTPTRATPQSAGSSDDFEEGAGTRVSFAGTQTRPAPEGRLGQTREAEFKCEQCDLQFADNTQYVQHIRQRHMRPEVTQASTTLLQLAAAATSAQSQVATRSQRPKTAEAEGVQRCRFCRKFFSTKEERTAHLYSEHADWKCPLCDIL